MLLNGCFPMPESVEVDPHQVWAGLAVGYTLSLQVEASPHVISSREQVFFSFWVSVFWNFSYHFNHFGR
jgi:hypothetical protein